MRAKALADKYKTPITFFLVFSAVFIRFVYYGFTYYFQLDDYIQYHNFATSSDYGALIMQEGFLSSRPLAGIADLFFWSKLYGGMIFGVLLISLIYAASAMLLLSLFRRYFGAGLFFAAFYTLLPLGFEGTYWMSASTRIVCGLFFASLAGWLFDKFCRSDKKALLPVWIICQLVSFCFYEQVLVFSFALTALLTYLLLNEKDIKNRKKPLWGLWSAINAAVYFIFTSLFKGGTLSSRIALALPVSSYYFKVFLPDISRQVGAAFLKGGFLTLFKGFARGAALMINDISPRTVIYTAAALLIAVLYYIYTKKSYDGGEKGKGKAVFFGLLLAAAPVAPFFFLGNPWFSLRGTVCSFAGAALAADALLRLIFKNKKAVSAAAAVFAFVCCVAAVSELHDYKSTYQYDRAAVSEIIDKVADRDLGRVGILNLNASYLEDQNYYYHEHIHGVTENSWALYGAAVSMTDKKIYGDIVPLAADGAFYYVSWNYGAKRLDGFDTLFFWDTETKTMLPVYYEKRDGGSFDVYLESGKKCARVWDEGDGYGHIELY